MFLHPKLKWKTSNEVWFMSTPISHNQLCFIVDKLIFDFIDLREKNLVKQDGLMRWSYMYGGTVCTSKVWYGGNRPYGPYFVMANKFVNLFLV